MIVTETEATQKVCPFAVSFNASVGRRIVEQGTSRNALDHAMCVGSACMSWDWLDSDRVKPTDYVDNGNGEWGPAGIALYQDTTRDVETSQPKETKEQFIERLTKVRLEEGFQRNEKMAVDSVTGWWKPHPNRRGQCGRTPIIEISQG